MIFSRKNIITLIILFICNDQLFGIDLKITLFNSTSREFLIKLTSKLNSKSKYETFQLIEPNKSIIFKNMMITDLSYSECKANYPYNCGKGLVNKTTRLIDDK